MALLFDLFGFLDVVFRLIALATQALIVGGIAFILLVVSPFRIAIGVGYDAILTRSRTLLRWSASAAALGGAAYIVLNVLLLQASAEVPFAQGLLAHFALAEAVRVAASIAIVGLAGPKIVERRWILIGLGFVMLAAAAVTSHSASRIDDRLPLAIADAVHQLGAAIWIGGIPYFVIALARTHDAVAWRRIGKRFSLMSMASVAGLVAAGLILAYVFVGSFAGLYGTSYGIMVVAKVALLGGLLFFGFMNFLLVERLRRDPTTPIMRMRRFAEAEIGVGLTVLALAASITSSPPAIDQPYDMVPWSVTEARIAPVWPPRLGSPDHDLLAIPALQAKLDAEFKADAAKPERPRAFVPGEGFAPPRSPADIAWSEYNHHWAGLFVIVIGILALLERSGKAPWARHWPLVFMALAAFLFVRSDPETWPLGDIGFFESLRDAEVFQHRVIVLLVVAFGVFEWSVRTGRIKRPGAPLVFPVLTAIGAGMLLMHSHNISNVREQFLIEFTHVPLAVVAVMSAWSRWLELRLPPASARIPALVWPICYIVIGLLLLDYREA